MKRLLGKKGCKLVMGCLLIALMGLLTACEEKAPYTYAETIRVGSLKGPTSMGLVHMMYPETADETKASYEFTMTAAADELVTLVSQGNVDIALLPANVAANLYQKTEGEIVVLDINTLGVLYVVAADDTIKEMKDLKGKTIYMTGKGLTPDDALQYLLAQNGMSPEDVTIEYKSEATEVVSMLEKDPDGIGLLPQPFVTTALMNQTELKIVLDLTKEWAKVSDSQLVTGVTIVRKAFLEQYPREVEQFLQDHAASVRQGNVDVADTAALIEQAGIVKAAVAEKAYTYCNIVCIQGDEMKQALSGYLQTLFDANPKKVGGAMPGDDFYYSEEN